MTTKPDSDGEGTQEQASSEGSDNQSNQKGSSGEAKYVTVEQFQATLNQSLEQFRRGLQSDKDRGVKKVAAEVGELREILQNYAQGGKSVNDVLNDLEEQEEREARQAILETAKALREGKFPSFGSGGTGQGQGVDVNAIVSELEMDATDTRVQAFRAKQFSSPADAYREGAILLKKIQTNQPTDADTPSPEGKRQSAPKQDDLRREYDNRSKGLYGQALLRLKKEMRDKGLEIS